MGYESKAFWLAGFLLLFLPAAGQKTETYTSKKKDALVAHWTFDEGKGKIALDQVQGQHDSVSYIFNQAKFKPSSDPLWRASGVAGGALLFDGYSTWVERPAALFDTPAAEITISAWVAPRSFEYGAEGKLSALVNQHDREQNQGFMLGVYRHGSWSFQFGTGKGWVELWDQNHPLEKNQWAYVVATYNSKSGQAALYLNGKMIASQAVPDSLGGPLQPAGRELMIGKHNQSAKLARVFDLNMYKGLLDELRVYDKALTAPEVQASYKEYLQPHGGQVPVIRDEDIQLDPRRFAGDMHRPQFHAIPPAHWMNEPHAPFYYNGKYHLFYQHNPAGPYWHNIHWGHWVSDDLVHWQNLPIALYPENDTLSPDGIWSGSAAYDRNGVPVLFFTAANDAASPNQRVAMATPADVNDPFLKEWVKHPVPLITQRKGIGLFGEFRDPFVWRDEVAGKWYLLNGSGLPDKGGTALLYSSDDQVNWEYHGPFHTFDTEKYPFLGPVWELPVFLPISQYPSGEQQYIFLVSPVGKGADVEVYYWLGKFDRYSHRFVPDQEAPQKIDLGDFHFTGPSGMVDPKTGRVLLFTIAQGDRTSADEFHAGWAHNAGLPVHLSLSEQSRLLVQPVEELKSLRKKELVSFRKKSVREANELLAGIDGRMLEVVVELKARKGGKYGLKLRRSPAGEEETLLYYDAKDKSLWVDRSKTSLTRQDGLEGGKLDIDGENLKLHIYLDHSMLEIYANRYKSLTTRLYPSLVNALGLEVWGGKGVRVERMQVWELSPIHPAAIP